METLVEEGIEFNTIEEVIIDSERQSRIYVKTSSIPLSEEESSVLRQENHLSNVKEYGDDITSRVVVDMIKENDVLLSFWILKKHIDCVCGDIRLIFDFHGIVSNLNAMYAYISRVVKTFHIQCDIYDGEEYTKYTCLERKIYNIDPKSSDIRIKVGNQQPHFSLNIGYAFNGGFPNVIVEIDHKIIMNDRYRGNDKSLVDEYHENNSMRFCELLQRIGDVFISDIARMISLYSM